MVRAVVCYLILGSEVHVDMYDDRLVIYSPGSMPEGHIIQDMNLESIPSIRRNPVIADIFAQLGYMERKGSGMGKILDPYKALPFFSKRMLPTFYSDRSQFTVTFPNMIKVWQEEHGEAEGQYLNNNTQGDTHDSRNVPQNVTRDVTRDVTLGRLRGEELDEWIAYQLAVHPKMTTEDLAKLSSLSSKTIKRHIASMQRLTFVGNSSNGYWAVGPKVERRKSDSTNGDTQNVPQNVPRDVPRNVPRDVPRGKLRGEDLDEWIAYQLAVHPKMTSDELAALAGLSSRTIKRHIAGMKRLKFIGNGTKGYWLVGPKVEKG